MRFLARKTKIINLSQGLPFGFQVMEDYPHLLSVFDAYILNDKEEIETLTMKYLQRDKIKLIGMFVLNEIYYLADGEPFQKAYLILKDV